MGGSDTQSVLLMSIHLLCSPAGVRPWPSSQGAKTSYCDVLTTLAQPWAPGTQQVAIRVIAFSHLPWFATNLF